MKQKRFLGLFLALAVVLTSLGGVAGAVPVAGENGYVSLHNYVSKTDVDSVYKVTLELKAQVEPDPVDVVFVLDASGSMNWTGTDMMETSPGSGVYKTRWRTMLEDAVPAAIEKIWGTGVSTNVKQKIRIAITTFGDYDAAHGTLDERMVVNTRGLLAYDQQTTYGADWSQAVSQNPYVLSPITTTGDPNNDLQLWVKAKSSISPPGGTEINDGLLLAYD